MRGTAPPRRDLRAARSRVTAKTVRISSDPTTSNWQSGALLVQMPLRTLFLLSLLGATLLLPPSADAAVNCPNPNPVVNENNCMGPGSTAWRLTDYEPDGIAGYATESSVDLGQSVTLKIALASGLGNADITVFRMGWYGGDGGRLVYQVDSVPVENRRNCNTPDFTTGYRDCTNWDTPDHPGLGASGIRRLPGQNPQLQHRRRQPGHLHGPGRRAALRTALQTPHRHLPGLQQLQRSLPLHLQLLRVRNDHRGLARRQGLVRPPLRKRVQRGKLVPQGGLPDGRVARARGI